LTVIIPAYNSAETLEQCLESLYVDSLLDEMEVLIVSDGSTDRTEAIARRYENKHQSFRLISKENGGHGSVINVASKLASGKYMKVLDSDDWVINLTPYIETLRTAETDVVFTNFRTVDLQGVLIREYTMKGLVLAQEYTWEDFWKQKENVYEVCNFHGVTYKTVFYNSLGIALSEGVSYEDQEYATFPFSIANTVLPLDIFLYEYRLGNPNQSVSDESQVKKFSQMIHVFWRLVDGTPPDMEEWRYEYFDFKKKEKLLSGYTTAFIKNKNKREGYKWITVLRKELRKKDVGLYYATKKQYLICMVLSVLRFNSETMLKLQRNPIYRVLTSKMH
jgi:glycosyltransferase involved in cell wall biosynthesis